MLDLLDDRFRLTARPPADGEEGYLKAWDQQRRRSVELKLLVDPPVAPGDPAREEVFAETARNALGMAAPHLTDLHDCGQGTVDGRSARYLVLAPLLDDTVAESSRNEPPELATVLEWGVQLCGALERVHRAGQVHADLRPDNVFLKKGAVTLGAPSIARLAARPVPGGAVHYTSPEVAAGHGEVGPHSDLYSLGCLLYFLVTGRPPFTGSREEVLELLRASEPDPSWRHAPMVPQRLDHLLRELLEKDPGRRPADAAEVSRRLREIAGGPLPRTAHPPVPSVSSTPPSSRSSPSSPDAGIAATMFEPGPAGVDTAVPSLATVLICLSVAGATGGVLTALTSVGLPAAAGLTALALTLWFGFAHLALGLRRQQAGALQSLGCGMFLAFAGVSAVAVARLPWSWWAALPVGLLIAAATSFLALIAYAGLVGAPHGIFHSYGYPWALSQYAGAGAAVIALVTGAAVRYGQDAPWDRAVMSGLGAWLGAGLALALVLIGYRGRRPGL
ncbi:protein kinase domain-containing protein [Streptomyces cyaneofuscatus]|uniref:protein kinase domain-containing protein n=1 Tax=Streptomyces cyaneofuscatus TaxID=66883 RepID=UPI0037B394B0